MFYFIFFSRMDSRKNGDGSVYRPRLEIAVSDRSYINQSYFVVLPSGRFSVTGTGDLTS